MSIESEAVLSARQGAARLYWYMSGQGLWFSALGLQFVVFPALGAIVLQVSGSALGFAQMSLLLPPLALALLAGVVAERYECRRLLIKLQLAAMFPPIFLALAIASDGLSYGILILYGLAVGTIGAFVVPARDTLLTQVAGGRIQQAVTLALGFQFAGMLAGMTAAGLGAWAGMEYLLLGQSVLFAVAIFATHRLDAQTRPLPAEARTHPLREMWEGLKEAFSLAEIRPVLIMMLAIGAFYIGPFMVVLPLLVRDFYGGGAGQISLLNVAFWSGTIIVNAVLFRLGAVWRQGALLTLGISGGLVVLMLLSIPKPFWLLCVLCLVWGCFAGISMSMSRTVVQMRAPESHRARILSIYQLSFMGGAPFGAMFLGILGDWVDLHQSVLYPAGGMALTLGAVLLTTRLWRIKL